MMTPDPVLRDIMREVKELGSTAILHKRKLFNGFQKGVSTGEVGVNA